MKKKFLSSLLFAALVGGAVSTFTACKDYDDDINSLQSKMDALDKALSGTKADLDETIKNLKEQLEKTDGELQASINNLNKVLADKADKSEVDALKTTVNNLQSKVSGLETRIEALETAKTELTNLINTKADKKTVEDLDTKVQNLYADIIASGGEKLGDKLKGLLKNEFEALKDGAFENLKLQLEAISNLQKVTGEDYSPIVKAIKDLQAITADYDVAKYGTLKDLADKMSELSTEIDKANKNINILTVLCGQQLRSLVFQPSLYYWGVEATRLFTLDGDEYLLKGTAWNQFETNDLTYNCLQDHGYKTYNRWGTKPIFKVLEFNATYHMNPSTAVLDKTKHSVSLVSDDKEFITRAAAAGLQVVDWNTENGDLKVKLGVADKNKIKNVNNDQAITVFAAQAHMGDTTITSDYATIVKTAIEDVKIYHKKAQRTLDDGTTVDPLDPTGVKTMLAAVIDHTTANNAKVIQPGKGFNESDVIPTWNSEITEKKASTRIGSTTFSRTIGPVLGTVKQAFDYYPQDTVCWSNPGFDLKELVCLRVQSSNGTPLEVTPEELGLHYKFELTALHILNGSMVGNENDGATGAAHTSESAHAALQGDMFRPQMVVAADGSQAAYGSKQDVQTVGRTPVVRVSLVDDEGHVYDYGYIRLLITPTKKNETYKEVDYNAGGWAYNYECDPLQLKWENTWNSVEYKIYNELGLTRDQFIANYFNVDYNTDAPESKTPGNTDEFKQYVKVNGKWVEATTYRGKVSQISGISSTGEETSTLKWLVNGPDAYQWLAANLSDGATSAGSEIAVRYVSRDKGVGPDVYVVLHTGTITRGYEPVATISWDALKNPSYWYAVNSSKSALDGTAIADAVEMHNNVLTPEDNTVDGTKGRNFRQFISATMKNNQITSAIITGWSVEDKSVDHSYTGATNVADLVFDKANAGAKFKGESNKEYTMSISADGKTLYATLGTVKQTVATITGGPVNQQQIIYGENTAVAKPTADPFDYKAYGQSEFAKDLLNYAAHNELADDVIRAKIGVILHNKCQKEVKHNNATIDVRFLRPINIASANKTIEDANTTQLQTVKLSDLLTFTDWRDAWKSGYLAYYGVHKIYIDNLTDGQMLSRCDKVTTNQHNPSLGVEQDGEKLSTVNSQLDFVYNYNSDLNTSITYKNFSSTVGKFWVKMPVTVEYYWGTITKTIVVNVERTAHNAPEK